MSAELGAIIGGATQAQRDALASYAMHVGRAFQIQDDLLDVVADEKEFGKAIGGDIIEGKKTYLLVHALGCATSADLQLLGRIASKRDVHAGLLPDVTALYERLGVLDTAREQIRRDTDAAILALSRLEASQGREMLVWFAEMLLRRNS